MNPPQLTTSHTRADKARLDNCWVCFVGHAFRDFNPPSRFDAYPRPGGASSGFTMNPANLNEYQLTFSSDPGAFYTLETSTTLTGTWTSVSSVKAENSTSTVLTSRNPAEPRRFWRMRRGQ